MRSSAKLVSTVGVISMITVGSIVEAPTAMAATYRYYSTNISLNGQVIETPKHIVAADPNSGQNTSYLPLWYLEQALDQAGMNTSWNGDIWYVNTPASWPVDLSNPSTATSVNKNESVLMINYTAIAVVPKIVYNDPASGSPTTYLPIYYIMQLMKRLGFEYSWDGTTWTMTGGALYPLGLHAVVGEDGNPYDVTVTGATPGMTVSLIQNNSSFDMAYTQTADSNGDATFQALGSGTYIAVSGSQQSNQVTVK